MTTYKINPDNGWNNLTPKEQKTALLILLLAMLLITTIFYLLTLTL
ncbi:MAG: hypothetical protein ABIA91_01445 [Patescibacteria group bacterium]